MTDEAIISKPGDWEKFKLTLTISGVARNYALLNEIDAMCTAWKRYEFLLRRRQSAKSRSRVQKLATSYRHAVNGLATQIHKNLFWYTLNKNN